MKSQRNELLQLLDLHLPNLSHSGGSGSHIIFPEFDLFPDDYLRFAEKEIERGTDESRINCVSHLKRAIDCELDTFFHVLNIGAPIKRRNLKFEKKMELVKKMGVVSPRSLTKLNALRNRLEHEYAVPDLEDIEVYFDLSSAFVGMIEGYIHMFVSNSDMQWTKDESEEDDSVWLESEYSFESRSVTFKIGKFGEGHAFTFAFEHIEEYAWGMKLYFMLCRGIFLISTERILEELKRAETNQESEPTPTAITPDASVSVAPSAGAAHL